MTFCYILVKIRLILSCPDSCSCIFVWNVWNEVPARETPREKEKNCRERAHEIHVIGETRIKRRLRLNISKRVYKRSVRLPINPSNPVREEWRSWVSISPSQPSWSFYCREKERMLSSRPFQRQEVSFPQLRVTPAFQIILPSSSWFHRSGIKKKKQVFYSPIHREEIFRHPPKGRIRSILFCFLAAGRSKNWTFLLLQSGAI